MAAAQLDTGSPDYALEPAVGSLSVQASAYIDAVDTALEEPLAEASDMAFAVVSAVVASPVIAPTAGQALLPARIVVAAAAAEYRC